MRSAVLEVKLVGQGVSLKDWLVPIVNFATAVGGVVLGGYLSRDTLFGVEERRGWREQALDAKREKREIEAEQRAEARELAAGRRLARGVARVLATPLNQRQ